MKSAIGRKIAVIMVVLIGGAAAFGLKQLYDAGVFKTISPHFNGSCRTLPQIAGPEDVDYFPRLQALIISSDHRPERPEKQGPGLAATAPAAGALYVLDLAAQDAQPRLLATDLGPDFHPHGITVWEASGVERLWVINHRVDRTTIEIFDFVSDRSSGFKLAHLKTLESPLLNFGNDLIATGPESFYVTSDHGLKGAWSKFEDYTGIGLGYVSRYDGRAFTKVASGIRYANGIALSLDRKHLFVAEMLGRAVRIYDVQSDGSLNYERKIPLGSAPDNLMLDREGALWIGAHPKVFALKKQAENHLDHAPAQVLWVQNPLGISEVPEVKEVYLDSGAQISAASVAFRLGSRLVLGSVFDDHLLDCTLRAL